MTSQHTLLLLLFVSLFGKPIFSQDRTIFVYDLANQTLDSLTEVSTLNQLQADKTNYNIGNFNQNVEDLNQLPPTSNLSANDAFTADQLAATEFDLNSYPVRTSVKIFKNKFPSPSNLCSGSFISQKHILTAAHCISNPNSNSLSVDSFLVCPVYDQGEENSNFGCLVATKAYFLKDWKIAGEDFAILELEEPLGQLTGWIGVGFDETTEILRDNIFYKFTYPNLSMNPQEQNYNGDTLYYKYGLIDKFEENYLGISNLTGKIGESGSSLIRIKNNEDYTSYGVQTYSVDSRHNRISKDMFEYIKYIIKDDIFTSNFNQNQKTNVTVFPNPTTGSIYIEELIGNETTEVSLYDVLGRELFNESEYKSGELIDINELPNGHYYLMIYINGFPCVEKIIKQ